MFIGIAVNVHCKTNHGVIIVLCATVPDLDMTITAMMQIVVGCAEIAIQ